MPRRDLRPGPDDPYPTETPTLLTALVQRRFTETGWTLTTVAARAGLSVATVSAIKNGTRGKRPRPATLTRLARGLELPEDTLLRLVRRSPGTGHDAR